MGRMDRLKRRETATVTQKGTLAFRRMRVFHSARTVERRERKRAIREPGSSASATGTHREPASMSSATVVYPNHITWAAGRAAKTSAGRIKWASHPKPRTGSRSAPTTRQSHAPDQIRSIAAR